MPHHYDRDRGTYLKTGWRVMSPQLLDELPSDPGPPAEDDLLASADAGAPLYGIDCTLPRSQDGRASVEEALDAITQEIRRSWEGCPRLTRDTPVDHPASRYGGVRFRFTSTPGEVWSGDLVWRSAHPSVAGAPMTTRVLLEERSGFTRMRVLVAADEGVARSRGFVGAGDAQPRFVPYLASRMRMTWMGSPLLLHPLRSGDIEDFVSSVLEDPARPCPVVVLAPREEEGYVVPPEELARALLGRARLHVIEEHPSTFDLTDAVGDRRMSCFRGAARCYLRGWSRHDDPYGHPLLLGDRLSDPVMRTQWIGEVGLWMAKEVTLPPLIREPEPAAPEPIPSPAAQGEGPQDAAPAEEQRRPPPPAEEAEPQPAPASEGQKTEVDVSQAPSHSEVEGQLVSLVRELRAETKAMASHMRRILDSNASLAAEVEGLRILSSVRSSSTNAIERRLETLEELMGRFFGEGEDAGPGSQPASGAEEGGEEEGRVTLVEVVAHFSEAFPDELIVLDSAIRSAADSPYEDPERVRDLLEAMARVSHQRQEGSLGMSLREAFVKLGIDYRSGIARTTSARLREQYQFVAPSGAAFEAEEHLVLGSTYDPRRCLRIYFSSRVADESRFVIGHVGRHFEVMTST